MFRVGTKVYKPDGYPFPGTVVAYFRTLADEERYVVESLRAPGMLHIFTAKQLKLAPIEMMCGKCRHAWKDHEHEIKWSEEVTLHECIVNMGMGDWCGCKQTIPEIVLERQTEVWS